jgi:hypothetical protein
MIASVLAWWTVSTLLGLSIFPLSSRLFSRLADRGYGISRALGLLAAGYMLWIGASFGILPLSNRLRILGFCSRKHP